MNKLSLRCVAPALLLSSAFSVSAAEKFPSPFGLEWGMNHAELQAIGFSAPEKYEEFSFLSSVSAPKPWSQGDEYLVLTYKDKLVKAIVSSKDITGDAYGSKGKELYKQVTALLTKKYGEPSSSYERTGLNLYKDSDEFYQCLEYSGCGTYFSSYTVSGGVIQATIEGRGRGKGYVKIVYESPAFYNAKKEIEEAHSQTDVDAF
ncbi:hypothetical protein [Marinomonas epiphytica]